METKSLTVLQLNDVHGYIESHPEVFFQDGGMKLSEAGGYARSEERRVGKEC